MANDSKDRDIQVYIGDESNVENMKDCSVVTATYELGEGMQGTIGIIGPKRMDYEHVMKTLKTLMAELDDIFHRDEPKRKVEEPLDKKMSNEEMVKEAVEEAKKAAEEETKAQEAENTEETEAPAEEEAGAEETEEPKKKKLFEKKNKKDKKDEQIADLTDKLTRHMAEFDNYRKRTEKEKSSMYEIGAKDVVEKILPIVDNFERGLQSVPEDKKDDPFVDGMDKIYRQLMNTLEGIGVKPIEAVGQEFDPNFHNAVMHVEDEELGENVVAEEFQKGYMYRDSVVRHSMVKVAN